MLIQISDDIFINTDQVNYIKGFKDIGDGKEKTYVNFVNKDSAYFDMPIRELTNILKHYIEEG